MLVVRKIVKSHLRVTCIILLEIGQHFKSGVRVDQILLGSWQRMIVTDLRYFYRLVSVELITHNCKFLVSVLQPSVRAVNSVCACRAGKQTKTSCKFRPCSVSEWDCIVRCIELEAGSGETVLRIPIMRGADVNKTRPLCHALWCWGDETATNSSDRPFVSGSQLCQ